MRVFKYKQNNMIDFFCFISGDRREDASAEYFAHAAAPRVSQDPSVSPLPPCRSSSGQRGDSSSAPDKGTSKAVPDLSGGLRECWQGQTSRYRTLLQSTSIPQCSGPGK